MVTAVTFRGDVETPEEKAKILDVVSVIVVVDGEPEHGMRVRILVSYNPRRSSRRDQDWGGEGSSALWGNQTQVIVTLGVSGFQLIELFDTIQAKLLQVLLNIIGDEVRDVHWPSLALLVGRNFVIGFFSEELSNTKRNGRF